MDFGVSGRSVMLTAYYYVLGNSVPYDLGNLFNDIRGETSACAQDGPPDVPKTDRGVRLMYS